MTHGKISVELLMIEFRLGMSMVATFIYMVQFLRE